MSYVTHSNAALTLPGRLKLAQLVVEGGWTQARTAERLQVSRATVSKWVSRYRAHGVVGLADHSSRPRTSPTQTSRRLERRIVALRFTSIRTPACPCANLRSGVTSARIRATWPMST
jgi:transposase-like protein